MDEIEKQIKRIRNEYETGNIIAAARGAIALSGHAAGYYTPAMVHNCQLALTDHCSPNGRGNAIDSLQRLSDATDALIRSMERKHD